MRSTVDHIIKDLFADLQAVTLTGSQVDLIKNMKRYYQKHRKLSEAQLKTLLELKKYSI